jgi:hypothetical protein
MLESAVDDTAEDLSEIAANAYSTFVDWGGIRPWFQILGNMPKLRIMLKSLRIAHLNLWSGFF